MTIPPMFDMTYPFLSELQDGQSYSNKEMTFKLENTLKLTEEDKNAHTEGGTVLFSNRVLWAKLHLKKAGLIGGERGMNRITPEGLEILGATPPPRIDHAFLMNIPQYREWQRRGSGQNTGQGPGQTSVEMSTEDQIDSKYKELRRSLEEEMLEKIKESSPGFFEELVVELIKKMGYGDGKRVGRKGDGGIDGEISQDELGMRQIYLQAKRWKSTVPIAEVRGFVGSLDVKGARTGIFITTSDFPANAEEEIRGSSKKVKLINGRELVHLMFKHGIGFKVKDVYEIKCIDEDFFP